LKEDNVITKFSNNVFEHMALQSNLMHACKVYMEKRAMEITLLALASECLEAISYILDRTKPWKAHEIDEKHVKEEVIDIYHFYLQMLVLSGLYHNTFSRGIMKFSEPSDSMLTLESACKISAARAIDLSYYYTNNTIDALKNNNEHDLATFATLQWYRMLTMFGVLKLSPEEVDTLYRQKNEKNLMRIKEKMSSGNSQST